LRPYVERLIGTLWRDCSDHILIFGEPHLLAFSTVDRLVFGGLYRQIVLN
jgi:hypothetical protein